MNKKVALLSMDSLENFYTYDKMLIQPMNKLGWTTEEISWRDKTVDWNNYDAVIVRSTWDYQNDPENFFQILEKINSVSHLENDLDLMRWNMNKKYLFDLEKKGIKIVDTIWENKLNGDSILKYFKIFNSDEIIIKPNISANADNTFRLSKKNVDEHLDHIKKIFSSREFMVQPFQQNIVAEGEYSLFFFNGEHSHAVIKKPKERDFRVQEEHGGIIRGIIPTEELISIGGNIINKLFVVPLYARIDLVRDNHGDFSLIELELIEPSLYFNRDKTAAQKFSIAFSKKWEQANSARN